MRSRLVCLLAGVVIIDRRLLVVRALVLVAVFSHLLVVVVRTVILLLVALLLVVVVRVVIAVLVRIFLVVAVFLGVVRIIVVANCWAVGILLDILANFLVLVLGLALLGYFRNLLVIAFIFVAFLGDMVLLIVVSALVLLGAADLVLGVTLLVIVLGFLVVVIVRSNRVTSCRLGSCEPASDDCAESNNESTIHFCSQNGG